MRNRVATLVCMIAAVVLPRNLAAAPVLDAPATAGTARLDEMLELDVVVRWAGPVDAFVVLPLKREEMDWGDLEVARTSARALGGETVVTQTLRVKPKKAGQFETPPLKIRYVSKEALAAEGGAPTGYDILEVPAIAITVREPGGRLGYVVTAAGLIVAGAAIAIWAQRRRRNQAGQEAPLSPMERMNESLHAARRHRLDGDFYSFYRMLGQAAGQLPAEDGAGLQQKFEERCQEVGYRGVRPTEDQMEGDLRDVERALAHWKETATP